MEGASVASSSSAPAPAPVSVPSSTASASASASKRQGAGTIPQVEGSSKKEEQVNNGEVESDVDMEMEMEMDTSSSSSSSSTTSAATAPLPSTAATTSLDHPPPPPSSSSFSNDNAIVPSTAATTITTSTMSPTTGSSSNGEQLLPSHPLSAPLPSSTTPNLTDMYTSSISNTAPAPIPMAMASSSSSSTSALPTVPATAPLPGTGNTGTAGELRPSTRRAAKVKAASLVASMGLALGGGGGSSDGNASASEGGGGGGDNSISNTTPGTAPLSSRAKRQRNVKFSPAKGPKATGRRTAAAVAAGAIAASGKAAAVLEESQLPNNDYCETCGGKGHFLCCDGCPRSFHFQCLDPPLELDELPTESWYCKVCEAARKLPIPPKGLFGPLLLKVESENPTAFELPMHIKNSFKNVTTGNYGEYVDTNEFRPLSGLGKAGKGGYEERDPYKIKDKQGRTVLCHYCREPANAQAQKRIVACDFCELHWHLDCVDPPLVGMPPVTRRFMCPVHADEIIQPDRMKTLKHQKLIKIKDPHMRNNGDIEILPAEGRFTGVKHSPEEIISQGLRYQVPEQIVILDFWTKVKRDRYGQPVESASTRGETPQTDETFDLSDSSSLTSMEATPEPSFAPPALSAEAKGTVNGSALLERLSSSHRSDREGTEISDGDPPDIGAWQAEDRDEDGALVHDAMMLVGDYSMENGTTPIASTSGSPISVSRPLLKTQSTTSSRASNTSQAFPPYDNLATLLSAAGVGKSASSRAASQASASSRQPSPAPTPGPTTSSSAPAPSSSSATAKPAGTISDETPSIANGSATNDKTASVPATATANSNPESVPLGNTASGTGSSSTRHSRQISFTLSGKKIGANQVPSNVPPTPAPSSAATVDDMQVDKEG